MGVATLSITVVAATGSPALGGLTYFLTGPLYAIEGYRRGSGAERIWKRMEASG